MITQPIPRREIRLRCSINIEQFMTWKPGELRIVQLGEEHITGRTKTIQYTDVEVPAPYDRLVSQLIAEIRYSAGQNAVKNDIHESRRRQFYAKRILDAFSKELKGFKDSGIPPTSFRSKILTPILQRQLSGLPDAYTPTVRAAVSTIVGEEPTIEDVTRFYLDDDPVDPAFIASYRRGLLHVPEPRWHLALVAGVASMTPTQDSIDHYAKVRRNHDEIMEAITAMQEFKEYDEVGLPLLTHTEVKAILDEGLETFFEHELNYVVRYTLPPSSTLTSLMSHTQPETVASVRKEMGHMASVPPRTSQDPDVNDSGS